MIKLTALPIGQQVENKKKILINHQPQPFPVANKSNLILLQLLKRNS